MLTQRQAEQYKKLLNKQLQVIVEDLRNAEIEKTKADDVTSADWTDVASTETSKTMELKIRDREKGMLEDLHSALRRIENKTFGECESCGERISDSRLKARPTTTLCIDCMTEIEVSTSRYR